MTDAPATADNRPRECRFRLRDEGKPYPKSSCSACNRNIATGLGRECHYALIPIRPYQDDPIAFGTVEVSPQLVLHGGKICTTERCLRTGQVRYFDVTAQVAAALTPTPPHGGSDDR